MLTPPNARGSCQHCTAKQRDGTTHALSDGYVNHIIIHCS